MVPCWANATIAMSASAFLVAPSYERISYKNIDRAHVTCLY